MNDGQLFWLVAHVDPFDTFYGSHISILRCDIPVVYKLQCRKE